VIPIIKDGIVLGVIDADSEFLHLYDEIDKLYLEQLAQYIATLF
jgi:GAF domain-containing protein